MVLVGSGNLKELRKSAFKVEIQQIQEHPQFPGRNDVSKNVIGVRNNAFTSFAQQILGNCSPLKGSRSL